jgi:hypothetical protein
LKICDPAVGSGHFLVSALNEIIAIKSELKILTDREGKRLKHYSFTVENDELIIADDDGEIFEYKPGRDESQRIQETIFHEKETIIENCLFGVDINQNSVKICRLRLWIELLKNAYYTDESHYTELETLPNIDINIKCGNSLISRFDLDADLGEALKKSKWDIGIYQVAVQSYRSATGKEQKRDLEKLIADIKSDFRTEISRNDPKLKRLYRLNGELTTLTTQTDLFEQSNKKKDAFNKKVKKLTAEISKLEAKFEEIRNNKIYENAFEWRFEFPEVLDDDGNFVGFDVVIGNPPYMRVQEIQKTQSENKIHYEQIFLNAKSSYDLANLFFERAVNISAKAANNAFIFPHKFFNSASTNVFRDYLTTGRYIDKIAHFGANMIFEDADTYTCIAVFSKVPNKGFQFQRFPLKSDYKIALWDKSKFLFIDYESLMDASEFYGSNQWILFDNKLGYDIFDKIYSQLKNIENCFDGIFQGIATSKDDLYILERIYKEGDNFVLKVPLSGKSYTLEKKFFKPFLMGRDVHRYSSLSTDKYVFFPYEINDGRAQIVGLNKIEENHPNTYKYIRDHETEFKAREKNRAAKMKHWYAYIYPKNLSKFEQPKLSSMEICALHPNVTYNQQNFYHTTKVYSWIKKAETKESYEYLLAIANSKLLWWFLKYTGDTLQGDARTFKTNYLNPFPIPGKVDLVTEQCITEKVKEVLSLKKSDPNTDTSAIESEIDRMVYALYRLTEEEIEIVENC